MQMPLGRFAGIGTSSDQMRGARRIYFYVKGAEAAGEPHSLRFEKRFLATPTAKECGNSIWLGQGANRLALALRKKSLCQFVSFHIGANGLDINTDLATHGYTQHASICGMREVEAQVGFGLDQRRLAIFRGYETEFAGRNIQVSAENHANRAPGDLEAQRIAFKVKARGPRDFIGGERLLADCPPGLRSHEREIPYVDLMGRQRRSGEPE